MFLGNTKESEDKFMKCPNCGSEENGQFCTKCGAEIRPQQQAQFSRQNSTAQDGPHVRCPRCGSSDLEVISDVQGKGASFWKLCCCGLLGLCGTGKTTTTHYWVCKSCGNKFKV